MPFWKNPFWKHPITTMILGVVGSVVTAMILNVAHVIEIRIPKTEALDNYSEVLTKAAEVIRSSDKSIYLATDVPAMGVISQNKEFQVYKAALEIAKTREHDSSQLLDITWLKRKDQPRIAELEKLTSTNEEKARVAHENLRAIIQGKMVRDRTLPVLLFFYLWTGESKDGNYGSVVAFNEGMDLSAPVKGFYSNSADVHTVLKRVQAVFASDGLEEEAATYYRKLLECDAKGE
jgi:hypothetical protein